MLLLMHYNFYIKIIILGQTFLMSLILTHALTSLNRFIFSLHVTALGLVAAT